MENKKIFDEDNSLKGPKLVVIHDGSDKVLRQLKKYKCFPTLFYNITVPEEAKAVESLYARDSGSKKLPIVFWEYDKISVNPLVINTKDDNCWETSLPPVKEILEGYMFAIDWYLTMLEIGKRVEGTGV